MFYFRIIGIAVAFLFTRSILAGDGVWRTITVRGEHTVEVEPDYVVMEFLVFETHNSAERAKQSVDERVIAVLTSLRNFSIDENDVSMGGVTVVAEYELDRNDNAELDGYRVSRGISIKLRDFSSYEALAAELVSAGVGELEGIESGVDSETELKHAALQAAAEDARIRAEAIASGLGVQLGLPIEVGENQLRPNAIFQQRMSNFGNIESVVVTGSYIRSRELPPLFVPENIEVQGIVWVVFELRSD